MRLRWLLVLLVLSAGCAMTPPTEVSLGAIAEPAFAPALERGTRAPIVTGNRVEVLLNGDEIFPAMLRAIQGARQTITYAQYVYEEGPVAREMAEALAERCRAGVGVKILLDGFGSLGMPPEYPALLRRSGCDVEWFRPLHVLQLHRFNHRNHRRILVADGRLGFTGGSGVSEKWMGDGRAEGHWRDTDVRVEGPIVRGLQDAFAESWYQASGRRLARDQAYYPALEPRGPVAAQVVRSSPAEGSFAIYTLFLLSINAARRSISITNPYFVPDVALEDALTRAVGRGVRVVVLVPGMIDHNLVRQASRGRFGRMLEAGVEIYEYLPALLHAKTMVVDGLWATVGSANLDNRSLALNTELNLTAFDPELARRLEEVFQADLRVSRRVTYETWDSRGLVDRLLELAALPIQDLL
jgi:cardiolipin synthase